MTAATLTLTPADRLAALSDADLIAANALADQLVGGEGLDAFIRRVSPHRPPPRHILPLIRRLEAAPLRPLRLCVSMPPRHAKTSTGLHALAWWIQRFGSDTCGYFTYNDKKGWAKSRQARALALAAGVELSDDAASVAEWRTVDGGGLLAGGAGGGLTGEGIQGLFLVDDPYKNREEAESSAIREKVEEWFNEVAFTRDEGCSFVVMHTRWHEHDLIGQLVRKGWEEIRLPALAEENDPLGRAVGEALWADRYPVERLERIRAQLGEFSWASLYQQRPRPRGSKVFAPARYYNPATVDLNGSSIYLSADPSATDDDQKSGSYSAAGAGRLVGDDPETWLLYLTDAIREHVEIPTFADHLQSFQRKHGGARLHVEAVGAFKAVPQTLRRVNPHVLLTEVYPIGDKFTRAQPVAAAWNAGRVLVPEGAAWVQEFVEEVEAFTGVKDRYTDQVDWLAHMWSALRRPMRRLRAPATPRRM